MTKRKIAVLGGGVGAMTAVYALMSLPGAQDKYDVTLYQMGWRLGGKGASGRRATDAQRIEEHGLHVWSGFYDNAIRLMKNCLAELPDEPGVFHSFNESFIPHNNIALGDRHNDKWLPWVVKPPFNDAVPGSDGVTLTPFQYFKELVSFLKDLLSGHAPIHEALFGEVLPAEKLSELHGVLGAPDTNGHTLDALHGFADKLHHHGSALSKKDLAHLSALVDDHHEQLMDHLETVDEDSHSTNWRRFLLLMEIGSASMRGILFDGVITHGFNHIDNVEISEWLASHGASETAVNSALIRAVYDYAFGFSKGITDDAHKAIGAGTFLHGTMRLAFTYKGAIFYKMRAGMGDTIFTPFYKALKNKGVKFRFFHKVTDVHLDVTKQRIEALSIARQATVKSGEYDPFVRVKSLDCWPTEPFYDQLEEGETLKKDGINLESAWSGWAPYPPERLELGRDFDDVILGISIGSFPHVCGELIAANPRWRRMTEKVETASTQAFQIWFKDTVDQIGWKNGNSILTAYADDLNTWADMTHLDPEEDWPEDNKPGSIAYFCGPMADPEVIPPFTDTDYPKRVKAEVTKRCKEWMLKDGPLLFPNAFKDGKLKPGAMVAVGKKNPGWETQFFRGNIDPSERYVLSTPGSVNARLRSDRSGFSNLWLAGDWTLTGINAGCVEAAAMSGLRCASGITGHKFRIVGEADDLPDVPCAPYPILHSLRPQNSRWPWSGLYGMAETSGPNVVLPFDREVVQKMLPVGLELGPQSLTAPGQHPVILLFGQQKAVRPNQFPWGMNYLEFICAVPWVQHAGDARTHFPPMITATRLYLNSNPPIWLGKYGYGFPKIKAQMTADDDTYIVNDLRTQQPIVSCYFKTAGEEGNSAQFAEFQKTRTAYEMAMVNPNMFGRWQYSYYDFSLGQCRVKPLDVEVRVHSDAFGLPPGTYTAPSIENSSLGGFFLTSAATINNPFQSWNIKRSLETFD